MNLELKTVLLFISSIASIFIITFLVLLSIFNQDLKGVFYLAGVTFTVLFNYFLAKTIGSSKKIDNPYCSIFNSHQFGKDSPSQTSLIIAFTFAYMWLPMFSAGFNNYPLILFLLILFVIDVIVRTNNGCSEISGSVLGGLVGFLFGVIWYYLLDLNGLEKLLYFNELSSNNVVCSKPSKQTFKCSVYKNGQLISSNIA